VAAGVSFSRLPAIAVSFAAAVAMACAKSAEVPPVPRRWATDSVGVLSDVTRERLDARLEAYQRTSKHHVLLYITRSSHGEPHRDWTYRVFNAWGIGRKGYDDGVVLFMFTEDDMRWIKVGYGLEDQLRDAECTHICRKVMRPLIQKGLYDEAAVAGVDAILAELERDE